jgi:hypothetical protein
VDNVEELLPIIVPYLILQVDVSQQTIALVLAVFPNVLFLSDINTPLLSPPLLVNKVDIVDILTASVSTQQRPVLSHKSVLPCAVPAFTQVEEPPPLLKESRLLIFCS